MRSPYPEALSNIVGIADDVVLVEDHMLKEAMRIAHRELGVVSEPAGGAGMAALLTHRDRFRGQMVGTILTGGNITVEQMCQWL